MAQFQVTFERGTLPPPTYDSYTKTETQPCGGDIIPKTFAFNSPADFIIGLNFSANYPPAATIRLEDFKDITTETYVPTNTQVSPSPGSSSSELYRISTGTPISYPHTMNISELSDIGITSPSLEIVCSNNSYDYTYQRVRSITFRVADSNSLYGEEETSTLITNGLR